MIRKLAGIVITGIKTNRNRLSCFSLHLHMLMHIIVITYDNRLIIYSLNENKDKMITDGPINKIASVNLFILLLLLSQLNPE
jgi:hypothetical protein